MKKNHKKLWKVLTIVFAAILVFCIVADVVTNYFFTSVNAFLLAQLPAWLRQRLEGLGEEGS